MSRSPFFFIEQVNPASGKAEFVHLQKVTKDGKIEETTLFPFNGCHDIFSIVEQKASDFPQMAGIHCGKPFGASGRIQKEYDLCESFHCQMFWFNYSDLLVYCLQYPKVPSYDDDGNPVTIDNPIFLLKDRIDAYLEVWDGWDCEDKSLFRIVYWIDY